ncbi:MAG: copper chaperone PCu(A)C [Gallionella sp.]
MMKAVLQILMALALGVTAPGAFADGEIQVRDPWVQAAPPNVKVMAAYLEISNSGKKPLALVGVASSAFEQAGIHNSVMHGNMVHMEHMKELVIPSNASVTLKPGGMHLMLTGAKKPLRTGDQVPITLIFKGGEKTALMAVVRSGQAVEMEDHKHMDHSGHGSHNH